jgi:hypothetical protein
VDVEKTIEFILESQARTEAALDRMAEQTKARSAAVDNRLDKMSKRMDATVKLIQVGMKLLVNVQKCQQEMNGKLNALVDAQQRADARMDQFDARMDRLAASQDRTEKTLNRFIASLTRKNKNGHRR